MLCIGRFGTGVPVTRIPARGRPADPAGAPEDDEEEEEEEEEVMCRSAAESR